MTNFFRVYNRLQGMVRSVPGVEGSTVNNSDIAYGAGVFLPADTVCMILYSQQLFS